MRAMLILAAALLAAGCPANEPQVLQAQGAIVPTQGCVFRSAGSSGVFVLSGGVVDLALNSEGYVAGIQVLNGLQTSASANGLSIQSGFLENNYIQVVGVTINYEYSGLSVGLPSGFFQYSSSVAAPGTTAAVVTNFMPPEVLRVLRTDPYFAGSKSLKDPLLKACLTDNGGTFEWENVPLGGRRATILVRAVFEGVLLDGTQVLSNEFVFPIQVCTGCLISPQFADTTYAIEWYNAGNTAVTEAEGPVCVEGQDGLTEWSSCFNRYNFVKQDDLNLLQTCATNAAIFQNLGPNELTHPLCGDFVPGDEASYSALVCRFVLEKVGAYCNLAAEAPLWP